MQIELLAGVRFEELLRIEIFDKQTVGLDAAQQAVVLDPDLGYTAMGAGDVRHGADHDIEREDGYDGRQHHPKTLRDPYLHRMRCCLCDPRSAPLRNVHELMRLDRYVPPRIGLGILHHRRYDALVYAPLGLQI